MTVSNAPYPLTEEQFERLSDLIVAAAKVEAAAAVSKTNGPIERYLSVYEDKKKAAKRALVGTA